MLIYNMENEGMSIIYHQSQLKFDNQGLCSKHIFAKFTDLSAWRIGSQLSQPDLDSLNRVHVLLRWMSNGQLFEPFHFVHLEHCLYHALCLLKQNLL